MDTDSGSVRGSGGSYPRVTVYRLLSLAAPLVVLAAWEGLVQSGVLDRRFFPPPSTVMQVLLDMTRSGELGYHLGISLQRILLGFLLGAIPGVLIGLLMGWFRAIRAFLDPIVAAIYPIPKISLLPLMLLMFGLGETAKVVTIAIAGFFLVLITTAGAVTHIEPTLIEAGQSYGARGPRLFTQVILPACLPSVFTGLRLALGTSLLVIVATEFVAADRGIGYVIWMSWSTLAVSKMYAGLVVIAALGLLFTTGLERLGRALMPWAQDFQDRVH